MSVWESVPYKIGPSQVARSYCRFLLAWPRGSEMGLAISSVFGVGLEIVLFLGSCAWRTKMPNSALTDSLSPWWNDFPSISPVSGAQPCAPREWASPLLRLCLLNQESHTRGAGRSLSRGRERSKLSLARGCLGLALPSGP